MHDRLQELFDRLQQQKISLINEAMGASEAKYFYTPGNGKWSIAQILTHLMIAEQISVRYMQKKSLGIKTLNNSGVIDNVKFSLLKISQRLPLKYKAPKVLIENTPEPLNIDELKKQWETSRIELSNFLQTIDKKDIRKKIYKHAILGRLDVVHALKFFEEHGIHHRPQIQRLLQLNA
jgi:uncharacterized damage-inducible protein DinB